MARGAGCRGRARRPIEIIPLHSDRITVIHANERALGALGEPTRAQSRMTGEPAGRTSVPLSGIRAGVHSTHSTRSTLPAQCRRVSARSHCGRIRKGLSPFEMLLFVLVPLILVVKGAHGEPFTPTNKAELDAKIEECLQSENDQGSETGDCPIFLHQYGRNENGTWVATVDVFDVSKVTDMKALFQDTRYRFNQPLGAWDVSSVTTMNAMFMGAYLYGHKFDQALAEWDVSRVTDMEAMFNGLSPVNGHNMNHPLGAWDVAKVSNMVGMFMYAFDYNHPLQAWDVSSVTNSRTMFWEANKFNQPLNAWDVSKVAQLDSSECHVFRVSPLS